MADNTPTPAIPLHLEPLIRRGLITVDPADAAACCAPRDADGFCPHRPGHAVYVDLATVTGPALPTGSHVLVVEDQSKVIGPFQSADEADAYATHASWDDRENYRWWNTHPVAAPEPLHLLRARLMGDHR